MLKMNKFTVIKFTVIGIATVILTFFTGITGFFESTYINSFTIEFNIFNIYFFKIHLYSTVLMLGICLGIISTFVKRKGKRKILFYTSIITIILSGIIALAIMAPMYPLEITGMWGHGIFIPVLSNNLLLSFTAVLTGPTIIVPYMQLGALVFGQLNFIPGTISHYGFKGVILWIGALHVYPEFYAIYLAYTSGIKISLKSFKAYISIRRNGVKSTLKTIKEAMVYELRNTMPKVVILLIIAALLEELWGTFWVSYWLQHIV